MFHQNITKIRSERACGSGVPDLTFFVRLDFLGHMGFLSLVDRTRASNGHDRQGRQAITL